MILETFLQLCSIQLDLERQAPVYIRSHNCQCRSKVTHQYDVYLNVPEGLSDLYRQQDNYLHVKMKDLNV